MDRKLLCVVLLGAMIALVLPQIAVAQPVVFTGNVETDFDSPTVLIPTDITIFDIGLPPNAPVGTISGFDIKDCRFSYDRANDELYVGINFLTIGGDPDGNGDPATTAAWLAGNGGFDRPAWGGTESFVVSFDFDLDGNNDVVAGLDIFSDINGFQIATADISAPTPPLAFDVPLPIHLGLLPDDTSAASPDIEFSIANASLLPEANFSPDQDPASMIFYVEVFAGSTDDDGVGEDFMIRNLLVIGKLSWDAGSRGPLDEDSNVEVNMDFADQGILVRGMSDTGNSGAFVNDYTDDPSTLDLNPNAGDFLADPFVLQTKSGPGLDDSDAGLLSVSFVSPISGAPVSAHYASVRVVDMEDAADRGNGFVDFNLLGGVVCTTVLMNGADGNIQDVDKGAPEGDINITSFDVKTGDADDSAAIDLVCWTYWEEVPTRFTLDLDRIDPEMNIVMGGGGQPVINNFPNILQNISSYPTRISQLTVTGGLNPRNTHRSVSPDRLLEFVDAASENYTEVSVPVGGGHLDRTGHYVYVALEQCTRNRITLQLVVTDRKVYKFLLVSSE